MMYLTLFLRFILANFCFDFELLVEEMTGIDSSAKINDSSRTKDLSDALGEAIC